MFAKRMFCMYLKAFRLLKTKAYQYYKRFLYSFSDGSVLMDNSTYFGKNVDIRALKGSVIDIRGVAVKDYSQIYADMGARIHIGIGSEVGRFTMIIAKSYICIGKCTLIAEFVTIRDQDHVIGDLKKFVKAPIAIGNEVWIGNKVTITKGVTIGDYAVIGANSVVTKSIDSRGIAVGAPAKIIKYV